MLIGIIGAGESGIGAALLAKKLKYEVFVSDNGEIAPAFRQELKKNNIPFEEKGHTIEILEKADLIVKSPGVPGTVAVVRRLRANGAELISEVEFAFRHCEGKMIGITGSNGKTTTASLCHHILKSSGINSVLCGNVGTSFARAVAEDNHKWYVIEVSSFQLDDVVKFRPDVAILLNITPDHLDRYGGDFQRYALAKFNIARGLEESDVFIYNSSDPTILRYLHLVPQEVNRIPVSTDGVPIMEGALSGLHNAFNAEVSRIAARQAGLAEEDIEAAIRSFKKPAHRMETAGVVDGVEFIDDSKATNIDATYYALDAQSAPVVWIAGGQDKGNNYTVLDPVVVGRVKALVCLGIDNRKLIEAFSAKVDVIKETNSAAEAVKVAASLAEKGDVVLLSPACASFDLFESYEERGDLFKQAVKELNKE